MADVKISALPSGTANASAVVPATNAAGTTTQKITLGDIAALGGGPPASHTHGNISNAGAIGTTSGLPVKTGTSGVLEAGSFGTTSGTFCQGNDSRLSDSRTPLTHGSTHDYGGADALNTANDAGTYGLTTLATAAEVITGSETGKAATPQAASLSRRGTGRSKLWEVFTDFNGYQSSTVAASGGDGFLWYPVTSNATFGDTGYYTNSSSSDYRSGVLGITSSTSGGYAVLTFLGASGGTSANGHRWDTGTTIAECAVYMSALATASNDFIVRFGYLSPTSLPATTTGGAWIEYNRANSTYWAGCKYNSPTTTRELSTLEAATGWTTLRLEIAADGTITFKINGTAITNTLAAVAASTYTARTQPLGLAFNKTSTNSASVYFDYVYSSHVFTADRT